VAPLFVTDTEVSVLLFDYYVRVLGYPLEYVIEALAPTPQGDHRDWQAIKAWAKSLALKFTAK